MKPIRILSCKELIDSCMGLKLHQMPSEIMMYMILMHYAHSTFIHRYMLIKINLCLIISKIMKKLY